MKRLLQARLQLLLPLAVLFVLPFLRVTPAAAATCQTTASYGAVTVKLPDIPEPGDYAIWMRLQASDSAHSQVLLEINQADCLTMGGSTVTVLKDWQWVPYSTDGTSAATYSFANATGNTAKVIGIQSGVKVDKIMVTPLGCVPTGTSDSCINQAHNSTVGSSVKTVPPTSNDTVSGSIYPTATIQAEADTIASITYGADGQVVQQVTGPSKLDTTLLSNGKHSILVAITRTDGTVENEVTVIDVSNPESIISPYIRWLRLHIKTVLIVIGALLILFLIWLVFLLARASYLKRRYLKFHGF